MYHTFYDNNAIRKVGTPGTWTAAQQYTEWLNIAGYSRVAWIVATNGSQSDDVELAAYEATDSSGTGAQALDPAVGFTIESGDDGLVGIEVGEGLLSEGFTHVALSVTPAAQTTMSVMAVLSGPVYAPPDNGTPDGVDAIVIG